MNSQTSFRTKLLIGGACLAISTTLASVPQDAQAQAFQATPSVVQGTVNIDRNTPNVDTIDVDSPTAVIDWVPDEISGSALDFLPTGATGVFQSTLLTDFSVLNRILPSTNGDVVFIDGSVISQIDPGTGFQPGGFVAFYSPTGILVGSNATFDVGGLMLTTLDPDISGFSAFTTGGTMSLFGQTSSTASIIINSGAQIDASPENSFFIAAAAQVVTLGTADINGSVAYVAGEQIDLTLSNGLFDIVIPFGTPVDSGASLAIQHEGTTTGPSSTGVGDNHMIYAVARAQSDPIAMLFRGNLGFQPAASAGIVNGQIIISANFDVNQDFVAEGTINDGLNASYVLPEVSQDPQGAVIIENVSVTSDILAISNDEARIDASVFSSSFDQDVYVVGRNSARIVSLDSNTIQIDGDVLVYADVISGTEPQVPGGLNATGGFASIFAQNGGLTTINGEVLVSARAIARSDGAEFGNATGGQAQIIASGGTINLNGPLVEVIADADHEVITGALSGGLFTGGRAEFVANQNGNLNALGDVLVDANAFGADLTDLFAGGGTEADAGDAVVGTSNGGGIINIGGVLDMRAIGSAGDGTIVVSQGAPGTGGNADIFVDGGTVVIDGAVSLVAIGIGTTLTQSGTAGDGLGGSARASTSQGGTLTMGSDFDAIADGQGGDGTDGGAGVGGTAGFNIFDGTGTIGGNAFARSSGKGGTALLGFGGDGGEGRGGNAFFNSEGDVSLPASLTITGNADVDASGEGGAGGQGDGSTITAGRGGDGVGGSQFAPNPVDPQELNGAYILGDGNTGNVSVGGFATAVSTGLGGQGGDPGLGQTGGIGGDGLGGSAVIGLLENLGPGFIGASSADFTDGSVRASGIGGDAGFDSQINSLTGQGGNGSGGQAFVLGQVGSVTIGTMSAEADGTGGAGSLGGTGTGGQSSLVTDFGGDITGQNFVSSALGTGGQGLDGIGGAGQGGTSSIAYQHGSIILTGDALLDATGQGGGSVNADGADGIGGTAAITVLEAGPGLPPIAGDVSIGGHAAVIANGFGGEAFSIGATGGNGQGGQAAIIAENGSISDIDSAQIVAVGAGGTGVSATGGGGTGGMAGIQADGTGSQITIVHNVPASQSNPDAQFGFVAANGVGGATTGGTGIGGTGTGGNLQVSASNGAVVSLPLDPANDPQPLGVVRLIAQGNGGLSSVDGGSGGLAIGGTGEIIADGGTVSMGDTLFSVIAIGGLGDGTTEDIDGGDAIGGDRTIQAINLGVLTGEFSGGTSSGVGGSAANNGTGGDGGGGTTEVLVQNATINLVGRSIVANENSGGDGGNGGSASAGSATFTASNNGSVNIIANSAGQAELIVSGNSFGGNGVSDGGDAIASDTDVLISESTVNGGRIVVSSSAFGGSGADGDGGDATAGTANVVFSLSTLNLMGRNEILADAQGGDGLADGTGGEASGGDAALTMLSSDMIIAPDGIGESILTIKNVNSGGTGDVVGDGLGGSVLLSVSSSSIQTDTLDLESGGTSIAASAGSTAGSAEGGAAETIVDGASSIDVDNFFIESNGESSPGGQAFGGVSSLFILPIGTPVVDVQNMALVSNGIGGDTNGAGRFFIQVEAGTVQIDQLTGTATGNIVDPGQDESSLVAAGGDLIINTSAAIDVFDDFVMRTGLDSIIGGPDPLAPTGNFAITSQGTISLSGDDIDFIGISGDTINLTSRDLDLDAGAVLGANVLALESIDTDHSMIVGGDTDGAGYTLTADETVGIEVFNGGSVSITAPDLVGSTADPELILRDLDIFGTLDDSIAEVFIFTPGVARVEGQVIYNDAGPLDSFDLQANERIEIITPGGIAIVDTNGDPTGSLSLSGGDIWAADDATIAQLQTDPNFTGRNDQLMAAIAGSDDPLGYIRAGGVDIFVENSLLVRNTGTTQEPGGILVGGGTLSIRTDTGSSSSTDIDVFAYGRGHNPNGSFTTGEAFYDLVNFNQTGTGGTAYLAGSEFNDCEINPGECANAGSGGQGTGGGVIEESPPVNNPTVVEAPVSTARPIPQAEEETNAEFGTDFPGLIEAPLLAEDPLLDDPVSSGGDSALYSLGEDESSGEDDEDDDEGGENAGE